MDLRNYCFKSATSTAVVQSHGWQSELLILKWPTQREGRWAAHTLLCLVETLFLPPSPCEVHLYFIFSMVHEGIKISFQRVMQNNNICPILACFWSFFISISSEQSERVTKCPYTENSYVEQSEASPLGGLQDLHGGDTHDPRHLPHSSPCSSLAPWSCPLPQTGAATPSQLVQDTFSMGPLLTTLFLKTTIYFQGRNRDSDVENRHVDTERGGGWDEVGRLGLTDVHYRM